MPKSQQTEIPVRMVVTDPVPDVTLRVQRDRHDLLEPSSATPSAAVFDFSVRVGAPQPDGTPTFLGPFTQGPPRARFVYLNWGRQAGQEDTCWDRRAKVPLGAITPAQVAAVTAARGTRLEVCVPGRGRDGGPICAQVKLPAGAWQVRGSVGGRPRDAERGPGTRPSGRSRSAKIPRGSTSAEPR